MGKIKELLTDEEFFVDEDSSYLTMARIMNHEWAHWQAKNSNEYSRMTGFEQIHAKNIFQDGFFAGFEARYFGEKG
jgi:hypothetical protein